MLNPTYVSHTRFNQLVADSSVLNFQSEFIISDWLLLIEIIYKKLARANGRPIAVTGHNVGALVFSMSRLYRGSIGVTVDNAMLTGDFKRLQSCSYDKIRFDRNFGIIPSFDLLKTLAETGLDLLDKIDSYRTVQGERI